MPIKTKNLIRRFSAIIALFFLQGIALSGCMGNMEPEPTMTPTAPQPTEVVVYEIEDLYDRFTVVGIGEDSFLEVHEKPSLNSTVLGKISPSGIDILPTGEVHQESDTTWAYITHKEAAGWVDLEFLAEQHGNLPEDAILLGQQVLASLKNGQYSQLVPLIDSDSCLRFSPYQYLNSADRIICPSDINSYTNSGEVLNWGQYDGTGKPIDLTFLEYHQNFVYDQDYQKPAVIGFNEEVSVGNSINNIQEIYPDGIMIEYYFPGFDPQYGGMDWRSLRLVLVPENDQWYLAAIIHGEWTI